MENISHLETDILIVGGGPAGLACALSLVRGGRSLIVCDDNRPRNKNSDQIRNLPGHEGISPAEYKKMLRTCLEDYEGVVFKDVSVTSITGTVDHFISTLSTDETISSMRIVLAEGLEDILPDIPGLIELWGRSVYHCPYCHGYENVGKEFGVLCENKESIKLIKLLCGLTENVSVFTNDKEIFNEQEMLEMRNTNIRIFTDKIKELQKSGSKLEAIIMETDDKVEISSLFIQNRVRPKSGLGASLGCEVMKDGIYQVNEGGESTVRGVYCAGDAGSKNHSVIMATAIGSHVGICVNADLLKNIIRNKNYFSQSRTNPDSKNMDGHV